MDWLDGVAAPLYFAALGLLCLYGAHRSLLVWLYYRHRGDDATPPPQQAGPLPRVLVQLPMFDERFVAERVIRAAAALRYPRERLEIQVLDDSTDATGEIAQATVDELAAAGVRIVRLQRTDREGYKAGALAAGLLRSDADLIAVFDADFVPAPDFLARTLPWFADPAVGMVQMRWGHLNAHSSLLTRVQATLLDAHFLFESFARFRSRRLFNFNGTAGVWRRAAIEEAGGWQHDTLTEDLDLSYRAQLAGWRFVFVRDPVCPAELPVEVNAFKSQQRRWTKGGVQTARKLLGALLRSPRLGWRQKVEAFFHLTNAFPYVLLLAVCLLRPFVGDERRGPELLLDGPLLLATLSLCSFYALAQKEAGVGLLPRLLLLPVVIATGIGLSLSNALAAAEGLSRHVGEFVRTPKHAVLGTQRAVRRHRAYLPRAGWLPALELILAAWLAVAGWQAVGAANWLALFFCVLFGCGFAYVGGLSALQAVRGARRSEHGDRVAAPAAATVTALAP